jgi:hypothetical protein
MNKPEVRIVEYQQEETKNVDVSQSERDYLLAKYGYKPQDSFQEQTPNPQQHLTFEQMVEMEERKLRELKQRDIQKRTQPKPYTFDRVNYSESKFSSLDLDGSNFGIQVQIVSDMPINNRR